MKQFEKRYILYGRLESGGTDLGTGRCELITNKLDTSSMTATISSSSGSFALMLNLVGTSDSLKFSSEDEQESILIEGRFPAVSSQAYSDEILRFKVDDCTFRRKYEEGACDKVQLSYYIPGSQVYSRKRGPTKHFRRGLLYGWEGWKKEMGSHETSPEWLDERNFVPCEIGSVSFSPITLFQECVIDGIETILAIDQLTLECEVSGSSLSLSDTSEKMNQLVEKYLSTLAVLEGDFFNWSYCSYTSSSGGTTLKEVKHYRRVPGRKNSKDRSPILTNRKNLQQLHIDLTLSYAAMSDEKRGRIDKVIERFLIASTTRETDTRLVYWHSCLDVLIKEFDGSGKSFSHRLLDACCKAKVDWTDLYPGISETTLDEKAEFPINKVRNDMLHHGVYPDDYDIIFGETRKARALCERLIASLLGVQLKETGFGSLRAP
ncbi:hypothetical protein D4R75_09695 [bacterium]|nr:MAG: hypothetical protein D4R75_09695 [bacterium]